MLLTVDGEKDCDQEKSWRMNSVNLRPRPSPSYPDQFTNKKWIKRERKTTVPLWCPIFEEVTPLSIFSSSKLSFWMQGALCPQCLDTCELIRYQTRFTSDKPRFLCPLKALWLPAWVGFVDTYDFFYLPMDTKNRTNVGYAFINFLSSQDPFLGGSRRLGFECSAAQSLERRTKQVCIRWVLDVYTRNLCTCCACWYESWCNRILMEVLRWFWLWKGVIYLYKFSLESDTLSDEPLTVFGSGFCTCKKRSRIKSM